MRGRTLATLAAIAAGAVGLGQLAVSTVCACTPPAPEAAAWPALTDQSGSVWQVGDTLATGDGTWVTSGNHTGESRTYAYKWQRCDTATPPNCSDIGGATASTYALVTSDKDKTIRSVVTATASGRATGQASMTSSVIIGAPGASCTTTVGSTSALTSAVNTASAGDTICLTTASYTFAGTSKAITIKAAAGETPTMASFGFRNGTCCFTIDGMQGVDAGGTAIIDGNAHDITMVNDTFTGPQEVSTNLNSAINIVFDHDTFNLYSTSGGPHYMVWVGCNTGCTGGNATGIVVEHSTFQNPGNNNLTADGVDCDDDTTLILDNDFSGFQDNGADAHTDPVQINGGRCQIKGNFFHGMVDSASCSLGEWDNGSGLVYENNVIYTGGCYEAAGLYGDVGGLVDHNAFITPPSGCKGGSQAECATPLLGGKGGGGSGTVLRDNIMAGIANGGGGSTATFTENHNLCPSSCGGGTGDIIGSATLIGPLSSWAGFHLSCPGSLGCNGASDGFNIGIFTNQSLSAPVFDALPQTPPRLLSGGLGDPYFRAPPADSPICPENPALATFPCRS